DLDARDQVVHPVQAADERALAATRGPDHRRDQVAVDVEVYTAQCQVRSVVDAQVVYGEDDIAFGDRRLALPQVRSNVDRCYFGRHLRSLAHASQVPGLGCINR